MQEIQLLLMIMPLNQVNGACTMRQQKPWRRQNSQPKAIIRGELDKMKAAKPGSGGRKTNTYKTKANQYSATHKKGNVLQSNYW
jgi:hypothetical protein